MNRLEQLRLSLNKSKAQVARELNIPYTTYVNYEKGDREPNSEMLITLARYFKCTVDYLIGRSDSVYPTYDNIVPMPNMVKVPLLGDIACGEPITAEENIETFLNMPEEIKGTFALRCKGDSMINARIFDGDIVFIREQPDVENGEIAAVLIDNEATLKRVYKYDNRIELRAENPTFKPLSYEGEKLADIRILGKAVGFLSTIM